MSLNFCHAIKFIGFFCCFIEKPPQKCYKNHLKVEIAVDLIEFFFIYLFVCVLSVFVLVHEPSRSCSTKMI